MSRDGSGIYSLPAGNPVVTGTTISSTTHNTTLTDIANALTASIAKDGQTTPTANLPMGTYRHTGVSNGTARDQYATLAQLQDGGAQYVGSVSGTDTITGSLTPAIAAYATGMVVVLTPANTNTGAVTLALNGLSAKSIVTRTGTALPAGSLLAGYPVALIYNGTSFVSVNTDPGSGSFTGTLTGVSGTVTGTIKYRIANNVVTMWVDSDLTGTSNSTSMTVTGVPSAVQPAARRRVPCIVTNTAGNQLAFAELNTGSGTMLFEIAVDDGGVSAANITFAGSGFDSGGAGKGLSTCWTITYPL